ncbi:hypothetical protein NEAUS03_2436, partial [Nematocida ausubeli]
NSSTLHFFLFSSSPDTYPTKLINLLERKLFQKASVSYTHIKEYTTKVSVKLLKNTVITDILTDIADISFISLYIHVPPYLLSDEDTFLCELDKISRVHSGSLEYSVLKSYLSVNISDNYKNAFNIRTDIFRLMEKTLNRTPVSINAPVHGGNLLKTGAHVYFESKILSTKAIIAYPSSEYVSASSLSDKLYDKLLTVDKISLFYALTHLRTDLEDILVRNESYIMEISHSDGISILQVSGFCKKSLNEAIIQLEILFISIVTMKISGIDRFCDAKVFLFTGPHETRVIGRSSEIKKILRDIDASCEISVYIPETIEEFICGKKNGKLHKVSRESDCALSIQRDKLLAILIEGNSSNAEFGLKMIEDEIPTEFGFYLHERHHKRIIGYGGKSIQRLMKKNGVYIKFESATESGNNVIIRTPTKNKESLYKMYKDVMDLAGEVPLIVHGSWYSLSFFDFHALSCDNYRFSLSCMEVFCKEPVDVKYYLVDRPNHNAIYKIGSKFVVASNEIMPGDRITTEIWSNPNSMSRYFSWRYEEPLFCDKLIWANINNPKLKGKSFSESWDSAPWRSTFPAHQG